jgi:DUF1680 family protein
MHGVLPTRSGPDRRQILQVGGLAAAAIALTSAPASALGRDGAVLPSQGPQRQVAKRLAEVSLRDVALLDSRYRQNMERTVAYLRFIDPDRMLHTFRTNVGLPSSAEPLGGWEAPDVQLRGHSTGHLLSGLAFAAANTGDAELAARSRYLVAELAACQAASPAAGYTPGYLSAFPEEAFVGIEAGRNFWAPYYTIHKILAGLVDQYVHLQNEQALAVAEGIASWVDARMTPLADDHRQRVLKIEFGGMNESLADLYALTKNPDHLRLAQLFDEAVFYDPLAEGRDVLSGRHANTDIPKAVGAVAEYLATGDTRYRRIASFFWDQVVHHHSYVIGGNSNAEFFGEPDQVASFLGENSCENCNSYNMIKLSRRLFLLDPRRSDYMDYIEWTLLNQMLGEQDPDSAHGFVTYYTGLSSTSSRKGKEGLDNAPGSYSSDHDNFSCDHGSGMETHTKFADSIYFTEPDAVWVNLYIPSELRWRDGTLRLRTSYPHDERVVLDVETSGRFAIKLRIPSWVRGRNAAVVKVNGRVEQRSAGGSYVTVERSWQHGDRVEVQLPMDVAWLTAPDNPAVQAATYGPLVLAGRMGTDPLPTIPVIDPGTLLPRGDHDYTLDVDGRQVVLSPFLDVHHEHYNVYWAVPPKKQGSKVIASYGFDERDGTAREARRRWADADLVDGAVREPHGDGNAVLLDGAGGHVRLPEGLLSGLQELTVSVWTRVDVLVNNSHVFNFGFNPNSYFFLNVRTGANRARVALKLSGMEREDFVDADGPLPEGRWTHVAVTLGPDGGRFYLDGSLRGHNTALQMSPLLLGATQHNYLGKSQSPKHPYLTGAVDDLRIFGRALDDAAVQELFTGANGRNR